MSQTIATSFQALEQYRVSIRNAINAKGGTLPTAAGYTSFATAIAALPGSSSYTAYSGTTTLAVVMQALETARQNIITSINAQGGSLLSSAGFADFTAAINALTFCSSCVTCQSCDTCDYCDVCDSCDVCQSCNTCQGCDSCDSYICDTCEYCLDCDNDDCCQDCDTCVSCDSCDSGCEDCQSCDLGMN